MASWFLGFILLLSFTSARAQVWTASQTWSPTWEKKFSEWVQRDWQDDFFARSTLENGQANPYFGMKMDCADTVYTMRVIFAYENKLPFVIQDPTTTGKVISNNMSRWNGSREIDRVRAFLWYLYGVVSTRSIPNDTFPTPLSREYVKPGSLILTTKKNHHSWTVKEMLPIGVPWLVFNSTVGRYSSAMLQQRQSWPNPDWIFEGDYTPTGHAGFRYWRPAEFLNRPVWETPGYSEEQYRVGLKNWQRTAVQRLATRVETDEQMLNRLLKTACEGLQGRVAAVNDATKYLDSSGGRCMDYPTYDTYSTPNRDRRVFDDLISLRRAFKDINDRDKAAGIPANLKVQLSKIFPHIELSAQKESELMRSNEINSASVCIVEYAPTKKLDMAEFKRRLFSGTITNNPHDDLAYRWGELIGPSPRATRCESWDPWSPDLTGE